MTAIHYIKTGFADKSRSFSYSPMTMAGALMHKASPNYSAIAVRATTDHPSGRNYVLDSVLSAYVSLHQRHL